MVLDKRGTPEELRKKDTDFTTSILGFWLRGVDEYDGRDDFAHAFPQ
jgi:hypothetical protein